MAPGWATASRTFPKTARPAPTATRAGASSASRALALSPADSKIITLFERKFSLICKFLGSVAPLAAWTRTANKLATVPWATRDAGARLAPQATLATRCADSPVRLPGRSVTLPDLWRSTPTPTPASANAR